MSRLIPKQRTSAGNDSNTEDSYRQKEALQVGFQCIIDLRYANASLKRLSFSVDSKSYECLALSINDCSQTPGIPCTIWASSLVPCTVQLSCLLKAEPSAFAVVGPS